MKSAFGSLLALVLIQSPLLGQVAAACENPRTVEVTVWRGTRTADSALLPEQVCPTDDQAQGVLQPGEALAPMGWGIPGLEEIAELVLASPAVSGGTTPRNATELPTVLGSGLERGSGMTSGVVRTVIVAPGEGGTGERILHLRIYEARPGHLDVDVQSGTERPVRLTWTRSPDYPDWAPGA